MAPSYRQSHAPSILKFIPSSIFKSALVCAFVFLQVAPFLHSLYLLVSSDSLALNAATDSKPS